MREEDGRAEGAVEDGVGLALDDGGIAVITLDTRGQGGRGNRVSLAVLSRLRCVLDGLRREASLRAVVVRAEGPDFSHGADLRDPLLAARMAEGTRGHVGLAEQGAAVMAGLAELPVPSVVAARGRAIGAGACFVVTCGTRFVAPGFSLAFPEVDRGMHLSWGMLPRLARELGVQATRRLALFGEALGADELPPGVVRVVDDPDAAAMAAARAIAGKPPLAVRAIQETLARIDRRDRALAEDDAARFAATTGSEDFGEAIAAWLDGRPGVYRGR